MSFIDYEKEYRESGKKLIAGIDEVGRGCLFGDVLSCAIIMKEGSNIEGVNDSKKLTANKRKKIYSLILNDAIAVGIGRADAKTIDKLNIKMATHLSMVRAIDNLRDADGNLVVPDLVLIDAENIETNIFQHSIIKGDENCYSIACASIIAKVYRDSLCEKWGEMYPGYRIEKHKGYGTKYHREKIKELGPSSMHRQSFLKNLGKW